MSEQDQKPNKSVGWVIGMAFLGVTYAGWAFMAADYFQHAQVGGPEKSDFYRNSVEQLPNFASVIGHAFQNRLWLIILIVALEIGVLMLWGVMRKLERELWSK